MMTMLILKKNCWISKLYSGTIQIIDMNILDAYEEKVDNYIKDNP